MTREGLSKEVRFELSSERKKSVLQRSGSGRVTSPGKRNSKCKGPEVGTRCLSGGAEKRSVCLGYSGQGQEKLEIKLSRQPGGAHTGLWRQWWGLQLLLHTGWKAICVSEQTDKAFSLTESGESFIPRSAQKHIQPHFKSLGNLWCINKLNVRTSLKVQWLRLCTCIAEDSGLIPGQETKIPHAVRCGQNKTKQKLNVHGSWYLPLEFLKIKHFIKKKL